MSRNTRSVPPPGGPYRLGDYEVARIGYRSLRLSKRHFQNPQAVVEVSIA
jgi:hypothetical protein